MDRDELVRHNDPVGIARNRRTPGRARQEPAFDGGGAPAPQPDLDAAFDAVAKAGGVIAKPIFSFPGGRRFHFIDPSGSELAVWSEA